jgi:fructosamine-3-kinase
MTSSSITPSPPPILRSAQDTGHGLAMSKMRNRTNPAAIHAQPRPQYGFDEDNYIGLNPQPNGFSRRWGEFFVQSRLRFQIGLIQDPARRRRFAMRLERSAARLGEFLDSASAFPSLVHGDLWNGNVLCGETGRVWLIDPAVYHADREVDLAMSEMFGGFADEFYSAYRARLPLSPAYPQKRRIYDLYHYLNHLNLFGDGYLEGCESGFEAIAAI